jgi:dipeptidyl aminopeptidase/acylaminoacyl peptidase
VSTPLIPIESFFSTPTKTQAQISPDGLKISYLAVHNERLNVWVRSVGAEDDVPVTDERETGVGAHHWTRDSQSIVYLRDRGGDQRFHLYMADLSQTTKPAIDLTPFENVTAVLVSRPSATPRELIIGLNLSTPTLFDPYRLHLDTGALTLVAENPGWVTTWHADAGGHVLAASGQTPTGDFEIIVRATETEAFRRLRLFANEDIGRVEDGQAVLGFSPDSTQLYVCACHDSDTAGVLALDCATGKDQLLWTHHEADATAGLFNPVTGELAAAFAWPDRQAVGFFDEDFERSFRRASDIAAGELDPAGLSTDASGTRWVARFNHDRVPGATYYIETNTGSQTLLFVSHPQLDPEHLAPMTPVRFAARDSLPLRAFLTQPVEQPNSPGPMVLLVHGGPWQIDRWCFHPDVQFLASRGYTVLQVNFRGSRGLGKTLTQAAIGEFGRAMHDDLLDAVNWAINEGVADPSRIGIYGGSYGGYAALCGVTFSPDVFAAAVDYVGPSDLVAMIRAFPPHLRKVMAGTFFRYCGDPGTEDQPNPAVVSDLLDRSPITHVDKIRTPLLIVQGANDPLVPRAQSDIIVDALRQRSVDVRYILKEDEGHGFVNPDNRLELYAEVERFFARHLGGGQSSDGA